MFLAEGPRRASELPQSKIHHFRRSLLSTPKESTRTNTCHARIFFLNTHSARRKPFVLTAGKIPGQGVLVSNRSPRFDPAAIPATLSGPIPMSELSPPHHLRQHGFQILEEDLRFLMSAFATALQRLARTRSGGFHYPWTGSGTPARTRPPPSGKLTPSLSKLLNIVEERAASPDPPVAWECHGPGAEKGLWAHRLGRLQSRGLGEPEILAILQRGLRGAGRELLTRLRPSARRFASCTGKFTA